MKFETVAKQVSLLILITFAIHSLSAQYLSAGKDTTICPGNIVKFSSWINEEAGGYLYFRWFPSNLVSDPDVISPYAIPDSTTTYYLYAYRPDTANTVQNGDFSLGNVGFTSSYRYVTPGGITQLYPESTYTVDANGNYSHNLFPSLFDHTHRTKTPIDNPSHHKYMIVNGSPVPNTIVWAQTVTVTPNTDYVFHTWGAAIAAPPVMQFSINGVLLDQPFRLTGIEWRQFYTIWNSGNATTANISIVNQCLIAGGNDFGLDDIFFAPVIADIDSVTIYKGPNDTTYIVNSLCHNKSYVFNNKHIITESGVYIDTLTNSLGCDSITVLEIDFMPAIEFDLGEDQTWCSADTSFIVLNSGNQFHAYRWNTSPNDTLNYIVVDKSGTYAVTVSDTLGCEVTDEINIIFGNPPNIKIIGNTDNFCEEYKMTLSIETESPDIIWNTGETTPSIEVSEFGSYSVTVRDEPCISVDTFNIEFCCPLDSKLPNVITPSQLDGLNDYFKLTLDAPYEKLHIVIYDRWGKQVFKSEDPKFQWGGTVGSKVIPGTYHYILTLEDKCSFHGSITVL